jgi:glycerol-3-phosphate acyltransferase PlsY
MTIVWLLASYLLGAIPTSYLVARAARGIDLREHGSRNLGATNLYRVLGWQYAVPVGLFDVAKGFIPVVVFGRQEPGIAHFALLCGAIAILGHVFSVFVKLRGGKGVATAAGVILGLAPVALPAVLLVWSLVVRLSGYVSLGSILAALLFPLADWLFHRLLYKSSLEPVQLVFDVAVAAFIVWKHRANIGRLLAGTENRFGRRATASPPP